jgi:hypothetical protein
MGFKKIILPIVILTIVLSLAVPSYLLWNHHLKPAILWDKTYYYHMSQIRGGIACYNGKYNRLPESLDEVVSSGFLPEESDIYFCLVMHNSLFSKNISYRECEFEITFDPNIIVIHLPEKVLEKEPYKSMDERSKKIEITEENKAYRNYSDMVKYQKDD